MKQAAKELDVKLTWGGDWKSFVDMPHYQIEV
jgi:peptidoglycan L-alanyl-D-glutamate endopeptidase CwlK